VLEVITTERKTTTRPRTRAEVHGLIVATSDCRIRFATPQVRRLIREFFGRAPRTGMLPRKLCQFARGATRNQPVQCIVATKCPDVNLFVRKHERHPDDAIPLLLEVVRKPANGRLRPPGLLTRREAEVLFWVEKAKSNSEVSDILGIAPATVRKHMERIFEKLGVENRTAAAHTITSGRAPAVPSSSSARSS
jgi:DNA-binding CsgD family transcriptional regulator